MTENLLVAPICSNHSTPDKNVFSPILAATVEYLGGVFLFLPVSLVHLRL